MGACCTHRNANPFNGRCEKRKRHYEMNGTPQCVAPTQMNAKEGSQLSTRTGYMRFTRLAQAGPARWKYFISDSRAQANKPHTKGARRKLRFSVGIGNARVNTDPKIALQASKSASTSAPSASAVPTPKFLPRDHPDFNPHDFFNYAPSEPEKLLIKFPGAQERSP